MVEIGRARPSLFDTVDDDEDQAVEANSPTTSSEGSDGGGDDDTAPPPPTTTAKEKQASSGGKKKHSSGNCKRRSGTSIKAVEAGGSSSSAINKKKSLMHEGQEELNDLDDWSSAWEECKLKGEKWGGRGRGGRGIQRRTWQPFDVSVQDVTLAYIGTDLLESSHLKFAWQHRYGLIGNNGVGKTTLLRRIVPEAVPGFPLHLKSHLVEQHVDLPLEVKVLEMLMAANGKEKEELEAECDALLDKQQQGEGEERSQGDGSVEGIALRLEEIYTRLDEIESHTLESRARSLLTQMGFSESKINGTVGELSGGWRMRLALACGLFARPDLLFLDEPTNHLDLHGILWLQQYLEEEFKGTLLVISHDREFLDQVCTDIILFRRKKLLYFPGNFTAFQKAKENDNLRIERMQEELEASRKHMNESIKRMEKAAAGPKGDQKKQGQIASRKKKLERHGMEKTLDGKPYKAIIHGYRAGSLDENAGGWSSKGEMTSRSLADGPDREVKFTFHQPTLTGALRGATLVQFTDIDFAYPPSNSSSSSKSSSSSISNKKGEESISTPVIQGLNMTININSRIILLANNGKRLNMTININSRIVLLGKNGAGKTTIIKLLEEGGRQGGQAAGGGASGVLLPTRGTIWRHHNLHIEVFDQNHQDRLPQEMSSLDYLKQKYPSAKEQELRNQLGSFGIIGDRALQPIHELSGGQQSRVSFAAFTYHPPHLLVLDEPTNHLDFDTIAALTSAIQAYQGAILLISHDQRLISEVRGELWEVRKGKGVYRLEEGEEGFEGYLRKIRSQIERRKKILSSGGSNSR